MFSLLSPIKSFFDIGSLHFENPWAFLLILLIPLANFLLRKFGKATMLFSAPRRFRSAGGLKVQMYLAVPYLWYAGLLCLIIASARPRSGKEMEKIYSEGIDIVIALDVSGSMEAIDFKPQNRIEAAKLVARDFVHGRQNDRIGLVVFAAKAFTQCPLTVDYGMLENLIGQLKTGIVQDGTAIGDGLIMAANRLRKSKSKSKVIILLTDGRNNTGRIEPVTAANAAAALGIRIYTIGMGKLGQALFPVDDPIFGRRYVPMDVEIDEPTLRKLAEIGGGKYFRATDTEKLRKIYDEIDKMEKSRIEVRRFRKFKELFYIPLTLGFLILTFAIVLENVVVRKIP